MSISKSERLGDYGDLITGYSVLGGFGLGALGIVAGMLGWNGLCVGLLLGGAGLAVTGRVTGCAFNVRAACLKNHEENGHRIEVALRTIQQKGS